jgi:hypothetical protein
MRVESKVKIYLFLSLSGLFLEVLCQALWVDCVDHLLLWPIGDVVLRPGVVRVAQRHGLGKGLLVSESLLRLLLVLGQLGDSRSTSSSVCDHSPVQYGGGL